MKIRILLLLMLCLVGQLKAQNTSFGLTGYVVDKATQSGLPSANVLLTAQLDATKQYFRATDPEGKFSFKAIDPGTYLVKVTYIGYHNFNYTVEITSDTALGNFEMIVNTVVLNEVEIKEMAPTVVLKGDTTQINSRSYKTNPDATAEDLVAKMPGITVDNGTVQAQGEEVKKVLVDGKPFFGEDPNAALKNLPAEVIDKVEIFDQLSEQAAFTGFDDGNTTKTINIVTKKEYRNGTFGRLYAGYGTDERYEAGGNINNFSDNERISVIGLSNNVNNQNFSNQDLLGVVSSSSKRRGPGGRSRGGGSMGRGGYGPGGGGSSSNNFLVGTQNGISTTHSAGLNYTNQLGEKLELTASYLFNKTDNENIEAINRRYILASDSSQFYQEINGTESENYNNRLNMRLDYKIDDNNSILFRPSINFQSNETDNTFYAETLSQSEERISRSVNDNLAQTDGYNMSGNLLYRHRFAKRGRTLSMNLRTSFNDKTASSWMDVVNEYEPEQTAMNDTILQKTDLKTYGYTLSPNISYTEPIGKTAMLQFNYNWSISKNNSDQYAREFNENDQEYTDLVPELSNVFLNDYTTNRVGVRYRKRNRAKMFNIGLDYQHAGLDNTQTYPQDGNLNKSFSNFLPNIMYRNRVNRSRNLFLMYRTMTTAPSVSQLQNVVDNSNSLILSSGNPDLKQDYTHMVIGRYSLIEANKQKSAFLLLNARYTSNYISNQTIIAEKDTLLSNGVFLNRGSQLTMPVNVDNYWNLRALVTYGFPVKALKSNLNLTGGITYTKTPSIINAGFNTSNATAMNLGLVLGSNISENVDFTISHNGNYNLVVNTLQSESDDNYYSQNTSFKLNWIFGGGFVFRTTALYQSYYGLSGDLFNQNYWLWNASIGRKFLKDKRAELQLKVYDLLDQNQSISRSVTETYVEDVTSQVLQQYFMLTFTYTVRNFKKTGRG